MNQGMTFVTVIADGRVYMAEEFATALNDGSRTPVTPRSASNEQSK